MNRVYVHLHRQTPPSAVGSPDVIAVDRAGDQSPWADLRGTAPDEPAFAGVTWSTSPEPLGDVGWAAVRVVDIPDERAVPPGSPTPGLKQVSLVRRRTDISAAHFRDRYRGHVPVVRAHHGVAAYAQTVDLEPIYGVDSDDDRVDGISELWFASRHDWRERFYLHDHSLAAVRDDTTAFIDFTSTRSILTDEIRHR